ncbi:MAG: TetR/AcrR family transcriptional regulator [Clostridia bacterium]|nr:TetR/AcrR family transcriptional regulator [Clostridia bacterium]
MNKSESKYFNTAIKMDLALISLLKNKTFEYITIRELCEKAEVNRSTFYLHYSNMKELLDETTRYLLDNFLSYFSSDTKTPIYNITTCENKDLIFICDKYLKPYLTYIKENKEVFSTAVSRMNSFGFEKVYRDLFNNIFNPILDRFHYPAEYRKYVMMYYLNGLNAIISEWLKEDCSRTIEEISEIITKCIFGLNKECGYYYENN